MDPELKRLLEENLALSKDSHNMLRAIRRHQWYSFFTTIIFWLVILIAPFYLYQQYLQPIVSKFFVTPGSPATGTSGPFGLPSSADIQKLINSIKPK